MIDPLLDKVAHAIRMSHMTNLGIDTYRRMAQAAIDAILPPGFVGFILKGEEHVKKRVYTDADAEVWADRD